MVQFYISTLGKNKKECVEMGMIPFANSSEYYIDNLGYYHLQALVPYSAYNYRVEVISPLLPSTPSEVVIPEVTLDDFNLWCPMFQEKIEDSNHFLHALWTVLIDIAKEAINYDLCSSDKRYKQVVSYYVAHFLSIHLEELKDEERKYSLDERDKDKVRPIEEKKINMSDNHYGNFRATTFGNLFWAVYGVVAKYNIGFTLL